MQNGKEIYEGDIMVKPELGDNSIYGIVVFTHGSFGFESPMFDNWLFSEVEEEISSLVVIGNIYEKNMDDLRVGEIVSLDERFNNRSIVIIKSFSPNKLFAIVSSCDEEDTTDDWSVMTCRLSKLILSQVKK